jgi:hypothetical protein
MPGADQPLKKPVNLENPAIQQIFYGLRWQGFRPVQPVRLKTLIDRLRAMSPFVLSRM